LGSSASGVDASGICSTGAGAGASGAVAGSAAGAFGASGAFGAAGAVAGVDDVEIDACGVCCSPFFFLFLFLGSINFSIPSKPSFFNKTAKLSEIVAPLEIQYLTLSLSTLKTFGFEAGLYAPRISWASLFTGSVCSCRTTLKCG